MEASRQVGGAVFSIQKQISAGLSLRVRSKPVNPAGSDMLLLYFCDGSLAGGNPSQMKEALKSLEYPPPQHSLQSLFMFYGITKDRRLFGGLLLLVEHRGLEPLTS